MSRRTRLPTLLCALGLMVMAPAAADHGKSQRVKRDLEGWPVAEFALVDHDGKAFTQERLKGQWTFLLLGDTRCMRSCTEALSALSGMRRRIATTRAVATTQVLFVSLDPDRDTPEQLRRYLSPFDDPFIGTTGTRRSLKQLMDDLSVPVSPPGRAGSGDNQYSGSLLLIGPDGIVRGEFLPPFDVKLLTAEYLKTRARR